MTTTIINQGNGNTFVGGSSQSTNQAMVMNTTQNTQNASSSIEVTQGSGNTIFGSSQGTNQTMIMNPPANAPDQSIGINIGKIDLSGLNIGNIGGIGGIGGNFFGSGSDNPEWDPESFKSFIDPTFWKQTWGTSFKRFSSEVEIEEGEGFYRGSKKSEWIEGSSYSETIYSGGGQDGVTGGEGNDTLIGGVGGQILSGAIYDNCVPGEVGDGELDVLKGGKGTDIFVAADKYNGNYYCGESSEDYMLVQDFSLKQKDKLQLTGSKELYYTKEEYIAGSSKADIGIYEKSSGDLMCLLQDAGGVGPAFRSAGEAIDLNKIAVFA